MDWVSREDTEGGEDAGEWRVEGGDSARWVAWLEEHATTLSVSPDYAKKTTPRVAEMGQALDLVGKKAEGVIPAQ
jgi:hypothetical protein